VHKLSGWELFADEVLRQAVIRQGAVSTDLSEIVMSLPGFRSATPSMGPSITDAVRLLKDEQRSKSNFSRMMISLNGTSEDRQVVALLGALEVDSHRRRVVAGLGGRADGSMTIGALQTILPDAISSVSDEGLLMSAGFITVGNSGSWSMRDVHLDASLVWKLLNVDELDPELTENLEFISGVDTPGDAEVIFVAGPDEWQRRSRAIERLGAQRAIVVSDISKIDWRAVVREATVCSCAVLVELADTLPKVICRWVEQASHLKWGLLSKSQIPLGQMPERDYVDDQVTEVIASNHEIAEMFDGGMTSGHRLTYTQVGQIVKALPALGGDIEHVARRLVTGSLDRLTTRIRPRRTWDDLVLPQYEFDRVQMVAARYRNRDVVMDEWGFKPIPSAGVVAMFTGPPGTGKTMSAEVIASDLKLDLFKVNLATMVSKFIGETEKNLEELFEAADTGNVVLLFDEADSIFGKRSEVSNSNDRYANLEVSYLLQRIERFDGLVILTTNLKSNVDAAFLRRINLTVDFQSPNLVERQRLWNRVIPEVAPRSDLDLEFLSKFKITGADIRSVALTAAFRAADAGVPISMKEMVLALLDEFRKQGRVVEPSAFGQYSNLLPEVPKANQN
jgi:AAA+ superfamily predicted ATPase